MVIAITETKNSNYEIKPFKMANDDVIQGIQDPLPNWYGFFMLIIGKPNSGKTTWLLNLLRRTKQKNTFYKKFDKVHIFSNSLHTITAKINLPPERLHKGIGDLEAVCDDVKQSEDKVLFIIDDCVTDLKSTDFMLELLFNRRHWGKSISIAITSQVYNKIPCPIRKVASDVVFFKTGNKKEIESIYQDFINIDKEAYQQLINHCFSGSAHDFIYYKEKTGQFWHNFNALTITES